MSLEQIVYVSRSTIALASPLDVADILDVSSRNNAEYRITGALTYCGDSFVQILEGPTEAMDWLMERLHNDPRHRDLDVLDRISIRERAFPEWSMLFPTLTPVTQKAMATLISNGRRHALLTMGREFRRTAAGY